MPREPKVQIFRATNSKWYGHRKAANGRITAVTQGYTRRASVERWATTNFPNLRVEALPFAPKGATGGYERPDGLAQVIADALVKSLDANPTLRASQVLAMLSTGISEETYDEDLAAVIGTVR